MHQPDNILIKYVLHIPQYSAVCDVCTLLSVFPSSVTLICGFSPSPPNPCLFYLTSIDLYFDPWNSAYS